MKSVKILAEGLPEEIITREFVNQVYQANLKIQQIDGNPFLIPV